METFLVNIVDKHFDTFELFVLKNIFTVPNGIKLGLPRYQVRKKIDDFDVNFVMIFYFLLGFRFEYNFRSRRSNR